MKKALTIFDLQFPGKIVSRVCQFAAVVLAIVLVAGCKGDISIAPDNFSPRLVVNSYISPGHYFEVSVKASNSPVSASDYYIPENVDVLVSDVGRGDVLKLYREDSTWVAPQAYPSPGHKYALKVSAPGFETIYAYTTIPEIDVAVDLVLKNFEFAPSQTTTGKSNLNYSIAVDIDGKPGNYPFIHAIFRQKTTLNVGSISNPDYQQLIYSITPEFPEEDGYIAHVQEGVMADLNKVPDPNHLVFTFSDYTIDDYEQIGDLIVEIRFVSEDYFNYFKTLSEHLNAREDPFAEPVQVFSNVQDGLGCFGGFSSTSFTVEFPE